MFMEMIATSKQKIKAKISYLIVAIVNLITTDGRIIISNF